MVIFGMDLADWALPGLCCSTASDAVASECNESVLVFFGTATPLAETAVEFDNGLSELVPAMECGR